MEKVRLYSCRMTTRKLTLHVTGQGFIMLLSGEPGVGKTLTAESGPFNSPENAKYDPAKYNF